jgi:arginine metabolism regulation protein II
MFKGDADQRRAYLVQTEKFIRVRGLSQPKLSSKKRALHHCYAFMRIIAETTCVADSLNINPPETSGGAIGDAIYEADFRISPNLSFSADAMTEEKDPELGQRDLHLAIPGRWSSTLFPTVYGVDELFLMLLSQVIRLANERDLSTMCNGTQEERLSLEEFWIRAKAIEKAINTLISSSATGDTQYHDVDAPLNDKSITTQAMSMSLLIFFYRRIYEVDPAMLQCKVAAMRTYLMKIQQEEIHLNDGSSAALIWPAFIAACEAVEPDLQLFFSSWFDYCFASTALVYASAAKQIFETIWTKRSKAGLHGEVYSWPDILREGNIKFTCV